MSDTIKYAGMFEVRLEGCEGVALCVDSDELQYVSDVIAADGHLGLPMDVTHRMQVYDAATSGKRMLDNLACVTGWLRQLQEGQTDARP